jgi:trimethylamine---corrinoid protein Co-methyltransferase
VRIGRGLVGASLATAPREITLHSVDPERHVPLSNGHVAFAPTSGPPNIMGTASGRRAGTLEDFRNLMKLCQSFEVIHVLGGATEPQDVPVHVRHLEVTRSQLMLTDKIPFIFSRGHGQVADNFELIRLAHGISAEEFRSRPYTYTIINTNSPLQLDIPMADGIIDFAKAGQVLIITPFTLAGAMAPVTIAGALTLAHAEALAGLTLAQIVQAGRAGRLRQLHLERRHEIRLARVRHARVRQGGVRRRPDGALPRAAVALLERDRLEHPRCAVRLRIADEPLGRAVRRLQFRAARGRLARERPHDVVREVHPRYRDAANVRRGVSAGRRRSSDIALEAVAEVGAGGHFFGCAHTMERYRSAFYAPLVSDWRNYGSWHEDGAKTATERASGIWQSTLERYVAPARDPAVVEALDAYVARRSSEGGAPPVT